MGIFHLYHNTSASYNGFQKIKIDIVTELDRLCPYLLATKSLVCLEIINRDQEAGVTNQPIRAQHCDPADQSGASSGWCQSVRESRCVWTIPLIFCLDNLDNAITSLTKILVTPSFGVP